MKAPRKWKSRWEDGGESTVTFTEQADGWYSYERSHNRWAKFNVIMITKFLDGRVEVS